MKRVMIYVFFLWVMVFSAAAAMAGDCYTDTIVKRWIEERDEAAEHVVQAWIRGASVEEFASDVAVILSNELYVCSQCRDQRRFLEGNIYILKGKFHPKLETVPGSILERLVGRDLLSPWTQFPLAQKGGARK